MEKHGFVENDEIRKQINDMKNTIIDLTEQVKHLQNDSVASLIRTSQEDLTLH